MIIMVKIVHVLITYIQKKIREHVLALIKYFESSNFALTGDTLF